MSDGDGDAARVVGFATISPLRLRRGMLKAGCVEYAQSVVPECVSKGTVVPPQLQ